MNSESPNFDIEYDIERCVQLNLKKIKCMNYLKKIKFVSQPQLLSIFQRIFIFITEALYCILASPL
mgnify:CR=1 FL=1